MLGMIGKKVVCVMMTKEGVCRGDGRPRYGREKKC